MAKTLGACGPSGFGLGTSLGTPFTMIPPRLFQIMYHSPHSTLYILYTLHTAHSTYSRQYTLHTLHTRLSTLHTLHTLHSTLSSNNPSLQHIPFLLTDSIPSNITHFHSGTRSSTLKHDLPTHATLSSLLHQYIPSYKTIFPPSIPCFLLQHYLLCCNIIFPPATISSLL